MQVVKTKEGETAHLLKEAQIAREIATTKELEALQVFDTCIRTSLKIY